MHLTRMLHSYLHGAQMTLAEQLRAKLAFTGVSPNLSDLANWGRSLENARLAPIHLALIDVVTALEDGGINSAHEMIALMAEGEGSDASVYQTMAKAVLAKIRPALSALQLACAGEGE